MSETITGITKSIEPARNLYPVGNCIKIVFDGADILGQQGVLATVTIPSDVFDGLQEGTSIEVNGVTFIPTLVNALPTTNENLANNIIESLSALAVRTSLAGYINNNVLLKDQIIASVVDSTVVLTAKECGTTIEVNANNLTTTLANRTFTDSGTSLSLKDNYRIRVKIFEDGDDCVLSTLRVPPRYTLTKDLCTVESTTLHKEIQEALACQLEKELPQLDNQWLRFLPNQSKQIVFEFGEQYGSPLNSFYNCVETESIQIINGVHQNEDTDGFDNYYPTSGGTYDLITSYWDDSGQTTEVCKSMPMFFYAVTSMDLTTFILVARAFDSSGTQLANINLELVSLDNTGNVLEINFTPQLVIDQLTQGGAINEADICSLEIFTNQFNETESIPQTTALRFNLCKNECGESFVFCSSLGVYESICTRKIQNEFINTLREFITVCEPCCPTTTSRGVKTIKTDEFCEFEVFLFGDDTKKFNEKLAKEFIGSRDVYWLCDGLLYAVEPLTDSVQIFSDNAVVDSPLRFRMYQYKTF